MIAWLRAGGLKGPTRMFSNDGPHESAWCLAAYHPPWSITWRWALYFDLQCWHAPKWWRGPKRPTGRSGSIHFGPFHLAWQPTMKDRKYDFRKKTSGMIRNVR